MSALTELGLAWGPPNSDVAAPSPIRKDGGSPSSVSVTREEELAALIAEQEHDAAHGNWIDYSRTDSLNRPVGPSGELTLADVVGSSDAALSELIGDRPAEEVRRISRPQKWTKRAILKHIRAWVKEHGSPPKYAEWVSPNGRGIPSALSVARHFGTFNAAITEAGFEPRKRGGCDPQPVKSGLRKPRVRDRQRRCARLTSDDLAAAFVIYDRQKLGMPQLAELLWKKYGYPSPRSCQNALNKGFHAEGFRVRTKSEARMCLPPEKRKAIAEAMRAGRYGAKEQAA